MKLRFISQAVALLIVIASLSTYVSTGLAGASEESAWTQEALHRELSELKTATKVRLLLVPDDLTTVTAITPRTIEFLSCTYETGSSSAIAALLDEISTSVSAVDGPTIKNEVRVGVLFYRDADVVASLYFVNPNFTNVERVIGTFKDRRVEADLAFGGHLKKWAQRPDVIYARDDSRPNPLLRSGECSVGASVA